MPESAGRIDARPDRVAVAVVGGGLIGTAAALAIARHGFPVALFERTPPERQTGRLGLDIRNLALSPASRAVLESVGAWTGLDAAPYRRMEVWEEQGTRRMEFDAAEVQRTELGWIVENSRALRALWLQAQARPELHLQPVTGELRVEIESDGTRIVSSAGTVSADLVIAADGAASEVRTQLGVAIDRAETGHQALATLVRTELPHQGIALQRFTHAGPLALLPSAEPCISSVVWSQPPESAARRAGLPEAAFCTELCRNIEARLGRVLETDARLLFPIRQQLIEDFNPLQRILFIGDAARVVHPLAGLGANLGLEDVRGVLARLQRLPPGADPGGAGLWRGFARQRRMRSRMMLELMSGLQRVYGIDGPWLQWLRNQGVAWLNGARPLKRQIMIEALGLGPLSSR